MRQFPFDGHKLPAQLSNCFSGDQSLMDVVVYAVDFDRRCCHDPEWDVCVPEVDRKGPAETVIYLPVQRYHFYYTLNFVVFMFFLNLIGLTGFAVATDDVADRIAISATVALAAIAYKLFCSDVLPKINYNTALDWYILLSFLWIFLLNSYFATASSHFLFNFGGDSAASEAEVRAFTKEEERVACGSLTCLAIGIFAGWPLFRYFVVKRDWAVVDPNATEDPYILYLFCENVFFLKNMLRM
ncbi:unnamed protein product [Amoebophrya sp. A120]|nr:unnamed protein product [Amoebophrya sp. A120]|eukprot:GSA120T00001614001.1